MKAAVISLGSVSSKWTVTALSKYFDRVDHIIIGDLEVNLGMRGSEVLYQGKPLEKYDCIYAKGSFKYVTLLRAITTALFSDCYMPIKASAFTIGHDKILTHLKLQQGRIPMPTTYISASIDSAKKILEKINYPIVMKFPHGTQGKGVMFADSFASASSLLDALTALKQPFLIQEYVETSGVDIRAIVVGNKVVASMKRRAEEGEKRANIHAGGEGEPIELDNRTKNLAIKTAMYMGAEICAVDMLETAKGSAVIEVNLSPGLQGITAATKIDVADHIAKYLFEQTKKLKESGKTQEATEIFKELGIEARGPLTKEILTNLDFRGDRILLPAFITGISKISETDEVSIKIKPGEIYIKK